MSEIVNIEALYEDAPCGFCSFYPDGQLIKANRTFFKWTELRPDDVSSLKFIDIIHKGTSIYYEMIFLPMLKMQGSINEINFEINCKSGKTFPALLNAVADRDEHHNLRLIHATIINISDRKKYERELVWAKETAENQRAKFETLAHETPNIIWTARASGEIDFLNEQFFKETQLEPDNAPLHLYDLVANEDINTFKKAWSTARKARQPFETEVKLHKKYENKDWYLLKGIPFPQDENSAPRWLGTCTNITQQMQLLQIKDDFISFASHELKTPITVLKSYLQLLGNTAKDDSQSKLITKTEHVVDSMQNLINHLLNTSHLSMEALVLTREVFDITKLLTDIADQIRVSVTSHTIELDLPHSPVLVAIDKQRMTEVISNLLTNAVKYSPKADRVILKADLNDTTGKAVISVQDFGIGIHEDEKEKIFDRYYRANTASNFEGFGLGLYIIQQIVKGHNSMITVESEVGKGSCFSFALDLVEI